MGKLDIAVELTKKGTTLLRVSGEFENDSVMSAKEELLEYVGSAQNDLFMDFAAISYVDSAGIGVLLEMARAASERGIQFGLLGVNDHVKKVLKITKVDKVLKIVE
jgi:anti-anti-sigma factor